MTTYRLRLAHGRTLDVVAGRPSLMGILNVTPDSFSDGGEWVRVDRALEQARRMAEEGAVIIDVGGESTRPGAAEVDVEEEARRVLPVIRHIVAADNVWRGGPPVISIDTSKAEVARRAIEAGAHLINDVTGGLGDAAMLATAADVGAGVCLMHMIGTPRTMQHDPKYKDVVAEVGEHLARRAVAAEAAGVGADQLLLDPGIGFGKTTEHNVALLRGLPGIAARRPDLPMLLGVSRKSFLARLTGADPSQGASDRDAVSQVVHAACVAGGAAVLRVHDVAMARDAVAVAAALFHSA